MTKKSNQQLDQIQELKNRILNQSILLGLVVSSISYIISLNAINIEDYRLYFFTDLAVIIIFGLLYLMRHSIRPQLKSITIIISLFAFLVTNTTKHGVFSYHAVIIVIPFFAQLVFSFKRSILVLIVTLTAFGVIGVLIMNDAISIVSNPIERMQAPQVWMSKILVTGGIGLAILLVTYKFNSTFNNLLINLEHNNKRLQQREDNLKSIFESTDNIIGLFDSSKKLLEFNTAFANSILATDDVLIPKKPTVSDKAKKELSEKLDSYLDRALEGQKFRETIEYHTPERPFSFLASYNPIISRGNINGVVVFIQDITQLKQIQYELKVYNEKLEELVEERTKEVEEINETLVSKNFELHGQQEELRKTIETLKKTQDQLVESEKMASLGILSAGVGHEINNPLNFIKGGIHGLRDEIAHNETLDQNKEDLLPFLQLLDEGVDRASEIVKSLSHFSRKTVNLDEESDIHSIIENCLAILKSRLKSKVEVVKNFTQDTFVLLGNEGKLHQAILNLLTNAEQAIENSGVIEISTQVVEQQLEISIRDSGEGISEKNIKKIMDPFFTTKDPGEGTGLGLPITHKIIKEHNGNLEISSKIGEGSTFKVYLPLQK